MPRAVSVTLHDLDSEKLQDELAAEVFEELTKQAKSLGLHEAPTNRAVEIDSFKMTLTFATEDPAEAKKLAWHALGSAVFAVHARHWIGRPGDTDPMDIAKGLEGKQVELDA